MSLKRVLEPEVMDTFEEADGYDRMDHRAVNAAFVEDLQRAFEVEGSDILDLGTGTAQIPVELAGRVADCRIMAVDLSTHMLDLARYNLEAAGLIDRIELAHMDAKELPFEDAFFDLIMSNSIVHHIPEPRLVIREAWRVLRPGGGLFFRDLLRPPDDATVSRLVQQYAGDEKEHQQQMFDDSLRAALSLVEIAELASEVKVVESSVEATTDRHWTWIAEKPKLDASDGE